MLAHQGAPMIHLSCTTCLPPTPDFNTGVTDTWHHAAVCLSARDLRTQVFLPAEQTLYVLNHLPIAPRGLWFLFLGYSEVDSMGWSRDISLTQGGWGEEVADERWKGEVQATPWQLTPPMAHFPLPNSPFIYGLMNRFFFFIDKTNTFMVQSSPMEPPFRHYHHKNFWGGIPHPAATKYIMLSDL